MNTAPSPERLALITSTLLRLGQPLSRVSLVAVLLACLVIGSATVLGTGWFVQGGIASICAGLVQGYWALRVDLDARLFRLMAEQQIDGRDVDWFRRLIIQRQPPPAITERELAERCRGALMLLKWQAATLMLQVALLLASLTSLALQS